MDKRGMLYGTTSYGGSYLYYGTVFKLARVNGNWQETKIYDFTGGQDGFAPESSLIFDPQRKLYGTARLGGMNNTGVVFRAGY